MQSVSVDNIKFDDRGLVPAIVQDSASGEVLMMAWMSRESLEKTIETGQTWFWSRSRAELWHKGATSGAIQHVRWLRVDCDADTLLVGVEQEGAGACHIEGRRTCFEDALEGVASDHPGRFAVLGELARLIRERHRDRPAGSYTTKLFDGGVDRIGKKVGEEAVEVVIAAKNRASSTAADPDELPEEVADLLYHLLVLGESVGLSAEAVFASLAKRRGTPGRHA